MARKPRKNHSPVYKAKVALEALKSQGGGNPYYQFLGQFLSP